MNRLAGWPWLKVLPITVVRVLLGVLWLREGIVKYHAGFGGADIGLVVDSVAANPRTPAFFSPVAEHVLGNATGFFGVAMPALETALGIVLILGVLTRSASFVSVLVLMTYWSADQLIWEYPVMVVLATVVAAYSRAASDISLTSLVAPTTNADAVAAPRSTGIRSLGSGWSGPLGWLGGARRSG